MAHPSKARKTRSQKGVKDAATVAARHTAVGASTAAAFDEPTMNHRSSKGFPSRVRNSSSIARITAINASKLRVDSMSDMQLNDMATKQLLAEFEATLASPRKGSNNHSKHHGK